MGGIYRKDSEESEKALKVCKEEEKTKNLNRCIKKIKGKVFKKSLKINKQNTIILKTI